MNIKAYQSKIFKFQNIKKAYKTLEGNVINKALVIKTL